jgi:hypothetical protein
MNNLTEEPPDFNYQCAFCGLTIVERSAVTITWAETETPDEVQSVMAHKACLTSVLHHSIPNKLSSDSEDLIIQIDNKILKLLKCRDSIEVLANPKLRATICNVISKAYYLQSIILLKTKFEEKQDDQFFSANTSVNRHFRDWGVDKVGDIYNELQNIAKDYIVQSDSK